MAGTEQGVTYSTPSGSLDGQLHRHPNEPTITENPDGTLTVHDPLQENDYTIGDGSLIPDPDIDAFVAATTRYYVAQGSIRQNNRTEWLELKPGTGRSNRRAHMASTVVLASRFDALPEELARTGTHDVKHRLGSHSAEDMLHHNGVPDSHDRNLVDYWERSGLLDYLASLGLYDHETRLLGGQYFIDLLSIEAQIPGFMNQPYAAKSLEVERLQYTGQEQLTWLGSSPSEVQDMLSHVQRDPNSEHGDQLFFDDPGAAAMFTHDHIRAYSEHWAEAGSLAMDALCAHLMRHALSSNHPSVEAFTTHHPADNLHALEEDWQAAVLELAQHDPAAAALVKIMGKLVAHLQNFHAGLDNHRGRYQGPSLPYWANRFEITDSLSPTARPKACTKGNTFAIRSLNVRPRIIDPYVGKPGGLLTRLSAINPSIEIFREEQTRWAKPFDLSIDLGSTGLGLSFAERESLARSTGPAADVRWAKALQRPWMTKPELAAYIQAAGQRYRQIGALPLTKK